MHHCLILFFLIPFFQLNAQIPLLNNKTLASQMENRFEKQTTAWFWQTRFILQNSYQPGWNWHISENISSNLLIPSQNQKLWKDEHRLNADFFYKFNTFNSGMYLNSWLQNDEQVSAKNQFANHSLGLFSSFNYTDKINIIPYLGFQQLQTRVKLDYGWDVGMQLNARNIQLDNYRFNIRAESNYDFYDILQNYDNRINLNISTQFRPFTKDSLRLNYSEVSKDNYGLDYNTINQAIIYQRQAEN